MNYFERIVVRVLPDSVCNKRITTEMLQAHKMRKEGKGNVEHMEMM